ncbi:O-antigen ligase family protein, partial [Proteus mirabilis]|uniref:O-antigen ligase family protein n=1 Tax=Proteus mirabilis TaxID=584 RepID=UPI003D2D9057
ILFTFSLAGIISFIFLIIIRNSNRSVLKAILVAIFSIFLFFFLMYFFNDSFFDRLYAVATGSDGSSNNRIIGSISRTIMSLYESPFGFGIGNSISGIDFYSEKFGINIESSVSTQNGFSEAIISCGIILGIAYLIPIFYLIFGKYSLVLFITISLVFFTTSSIFISPMWFLISAAIFLKKYMINGQ